MSFRVLEVDQWTSTGNVTDFSMDEWKADTKATLKKVTGGDSETVRLIFGGRALVREVSENDSPMIGHVWFKEDLNNKKLTLYRSNYDSSD